MTMTYPIIQPPFTLKFDEMSKRELHDYRAWFMDVMPVRIKVLEDVVRTTPGFESWRGDCSPESLNALGEWFADQVATRPRTAEEMAEMKAQRGELAVKMGLTLEDWELTNRTYSLAMDIGMYLGEVMRKTHSSLVWDQYLKNKRDSDYGQVSIEGTRVVSMNTVSFLIGIAGSIVRKTKTGVALRQTYDIWSGPESGLFAPPLPKKSTKSAAHKSAKAEST